MRVPFIYTEKIDSILIEMRKKGLVFKANQGIGYLEFIGDFTTQQRREIKSLAQVCNDDVPLTYKTDVLLYSDIFFNVTGVEQLLRIEAALKEHPFMMLFARDYSYTNVRGELQRCLQEGLLTQEDLDFIDTVMPIQITDE